MSDGPRPSGSSPFAPPEPLRETFQVHSYEADAWGLLAAPALGGWLQEAAGLHAERLGVGMDGLLARGLTWVLSRQRVELDRPIALGDEVVVATWPTGVSRLAAVRDFELTCGGARVARAVTHWLVMDLETRRPVKVERVLPPELVPEQPHVLSPSPSRPPPVEAPEEERRFSIRYRDIDRNLHVTNASYVAWAVEAVPQEVWRTLRLRGFEAHFLAECRLGSTVVSRSAPLAPAVPGVPGTLPARELVHSIVREEDGKELARLRTTWVDRGA
jgi:medium-chain acyl-[acyl-carrier-protein] hydrolase